MNTLHYNCGIYAIWNRVNGKVYIGSAVSIKGRWKVHKRDLNRGANSPRLQNAWNKYGPEAFEFCPLEQVDCKEDLISREQVWINRFRSTDEIHGYNIAANAGSSLGVKHTPEARANMSAAGMGRKFTNEHRANLSAAGMGRKHTAERRANISAAVMGRKMSAESIEKTRLANFRSQAHC